MQKPANFRMNIAFFRSHLLTCLYKQTKMVWKPCICLFAQILRVFPWNFVRIQVIAEMNIECEGRNKANEHVGYSRN